MVLVGVMISLLLDLLLKNYGGNTNQNYLMNHFTSILITLIVWEGNFGIDILIDRVISWHKFPVKRVVIQFTISIIYSFIVIYTSMYFFNKYICLLPKATQQVFLNTAVIIGLLITIIILAFELGIQFFKSWKVSITEIEKYKTLSVQAELQNLKNQLNPHFLFNNLSVLTSLVYVDQDKAVEFINQLSKVYRYLLETTSDELVNLEQELNFIAAYEFLLKIRFGENIHFVHQDETTVKNKLIPPVSLQILVENAIKHNVVSAKYPLTIHLRINQDWIEVSNAIHLRDNYEKGTQSGLLNIQKRYKILSERKVEISNVDGLFKVRLPLLSIEKENR